MYLYQQIAQSFQAWQNCRDSGNVEWKGRHAEKIRDLVREHMPSGSGFDAGTQFDFDASKPDRLVFTTAYHHMNDGGMYAGWTEHRVTVTPDFSGVNVRVSGRDRDQIKDYVAEMFYGCLSLELASVGKGE